MSGRPDGKSAEQIRRATLRQIRFHTTYRKCSSCKEKKPGVVRIRNYQMCQDCIKRVNARYGR